MKQCGILVFIFVVFSSNVLSSQETEPLLGAERYLEIVVGRLLDEGFNSRTIFHRRAMEGFKLAQGLIDNYSPEQYNLARLSGLKADHPEYQTILSEVGFHAPLVELSDRSGMKHIVDLFLSADQNSSCKGSIQELKTTAVTLKGKASLDKVNLLISILSEKC